MNAGKPALFWTLATLALTLPSRAADGGPGATPPQRMTYKAVVPDATKSEARWRYTFERPGEDWFKADFDDAAWKEGPGGFGTANTPGAVVRTTWNTGDVWLRRSVELPAGKADDLALSIHHDEDAEVYLNGVRAAAVRGYSTDYEMTPIAPEARAALRPGKNLLAVHCHQTRGGQYIDVGLVAGTPSPTKDYVPPAIPLVVHDPYFSIWSCADNLADDWPKHWTGAAHPLASLVRIDGKTFRLMGLPDSTLPALPQTSVKVLPTRTVYGFEGDGVRVALTFTTPALPDDLDVLARPLTYLTWEAAAGDGKPHDVWVYFDASAALVVNDPRQEVVGAPVEAPGLTALRMGSREQPVLRRAGDRVRIDWGYLYAAAPEGQASAVVSGGDAARKAFAASGRLPEADDTRLPRAAGDDTPVLAFRLDLGRVADKPQSRTLMLAYDEVYAVELLGKKLRPYWRRGGMEPAGLLAKAAKEFDALRARCERFDKELSEDLERAGGPAYERVGVLAYRQAFAGCGLAADESGRPLMFAKENTSNGCVATVDVQYPACPLFLLFNPALLEAHLTPVFEYAESPRWTFPFAPHDLGTYPRADGQVYGGGEKTEENQMPVEESGNMLIMVAALAKARGDASYAARHWPALTRWAEYLKRKGFDPENQLCTDDFAGHLAHNVNLSAKAIVALGGYAKLAERLGKPGPAAEYGALARQYALRWAKEADDSTRYRLAFDKPGTWSQKYNLVWDQLLGLGLFPPAAVHKEVAFYRKAQNTFGLPLDSRADYTKSDWLLWTATLCDSRGDFDALVAPLADSLARTPSRVPMTDFYDTRTARTRGMYARPVVGGVFIKLLDDEALWRKWARRARVPGTTPADGRRASK
jgi:hypothetical protein